MKSPSLLNNKQRGRLIQKSGPYNRSHSEYFRAAHIHPFGSKNLRRFYRKTNDCMRTECSKRFDFILSP